jgi:putative membrane protein
MQRHTNLKLMLGVAALTTLFGATSVYAQAGKDASGMSKENQAGQMNSSGQSGTSNAASSSGSSGAADTASGSGKSASGKALSKSDQNMMRDMAYANLSEIEAAKVAQSQSNNDQVKTFAKKMIDDHTQAQQELTQLAQSKGVTLPTEPDHKHMAEVKKMSAMQGDKFDKMYMQQGGMTDHRDTHRLLSKVQQSASDPDLKALATKMTPIVDQHMTMAQDIHSGKGSASGASGTSGTGAAGSTK